jgi:hypothetical protein
MRATSRRNQKKVGLRVAKLIQSKRGYKPPFPIQKCSELFIGTHNEPLSVAAMRVSNPACALVAIHG